MDLFSRIPTRIFARSFKLKADCPLDPLCRSYTGKIPVVLDEDLSDQTVSFGLPPWPLGVAWGRFVVFLFFFLSIPVVIFAQETLRVRVFTSDGRNLPAALVLVFNRDAGTLTEFHPEPNGEILLDPKLLNNSVLRISHLGYRTRVLDNPGQGELESVILKTSPVLIEGIEVGAERSNPCRDANISAAQILARTAGSYGDQPTQQVSVASETGEVVALAGDVSIRDRHPKTTVWNSPYLRRWGPGVLQDRIDDLGYIFEGSAGQKVIPDLGGKQAPFFVSSGFLANHDFWVENSDSAETMFGFCGRGPNDTEIRGGLLLDSRGFFSYSFWEIREDNKTYANGVVHFLEPPSTDDIPYQLLPVRSQTWTKTGRRDQVTGKELVRLIDSIFLKWKIDGLYYGPMVTPKVG